MNLLIKHVQNNLASTSSQVVTFSNLSVPLAKLSQFSNLIERLNKFIHEPIKGKPLHYDSNITKAFSEGAKSLTEEDKKQILLNAFSDNKYQH